MSEAPRLGTQVQVQGLQARPDLNGKRGWVTGYDEDADRVEVTFDGSSCQKVKVKSINAVPLTRLQSPSDGLTVGAFIEITGLQSRGDLNGRRGSIVSRDEAAGRVEVHLDGPNGGERIKCKLANAKFVSPKLDLGSAVEMAATAARLKAQGGNASSRWDETSWGRPKTTDHRYGESRGGGDRRSRSRSRSRDRDRDRDRDRQRERSRSRPKPAPIPMRPVPAPAPVFAGGVIENRAQDWVCRCGERNFARRNTCFRCGAARTNSAPLYQGPTHLQEKRAAQANRISLAAPGPRPFGGPLGEWTTAKELLKGEDWDNLRKKVDERRNKKKKKSRASTSSSSSSSSESKESSSSAGSEKKKEKKSAPPAAPSNPELDKLKNDALQRLLNIKEQPLPTRKKMWRALLLEFHPDKQPDNKENATAVFQFLQKGKALLDFKSGE